MKLSCSLDLTRITEQMTTNGRVHIPDVLDSNCADTIYNTVHTSPKWNLVFREDGKHVDIDADSVNLWNAEQKQKFADIVHGNAARSFQYMYKNIPLYDIYHDQLLPDHFYHQIFEFLNSEHFLGFARNVLQKPEISFADAQITCYEAGHFLTTHNDDVVGKNRVAAYVLNLTRNWNPDWGGALQFFSEAGHVEEAYTPTFNALNIFTVPMSHSVGYVAPFAQGQRYSITGWFRTGQDPRIKVHR